MFRHFLSHRKPGSRARGVRAPWAAARKRAHPTLECLEDRTVPTVLFAPQFGSETPVGVVPPKDGGQRINSPNLYAVLWGSSWGGEATPNAIQVYSGISGVVISHYLDGIAQYGVTTNVHFKGTLFDNTPDPTSGFTQQSMFQEIERLITAKQLPDPTQTPNMIVDMVTARNITSALIGAGGYNSEAVNGNQSFRYGFIWNGTSFGSLSLRDSTSLIFSHELAEAMTDPGGNGFQVNNGNKWTVTPPASSPNQIGDFEGNNYEYRLDNSVLVQPYWSGAKNSPYPNQWLVTDGNVQTINVTPNWTKNADGTQSGFMNYDVTVNGGQLGQADNLTVANLGSGDQPSVLAIVLNNELFELDSTAPNGVQQLGTLTANISKGVVHINGSPMMSHITINGSSGTEVDVAAAQASLSISGAGTVAIGNNGNLDGIQSRGITISNQNGDTGVVIDDRNRGGGPRTATFDTLSTNPQYLQLNDLIPGTIYVQRTTTAKNIDVYTGTGQVTVNVLATIGRGLNLIGNSPDTTVNIGKNGSLDSIQSLQMTVSNTNSDTGVVIDDRHRGGTRTATIDTLSTNPQYLQLNGDWIPTTIYVQRTTTTKNIDVYTGTGQVTVNVLATIGRGLNLIGNSANTTVIVGKNGSLDAIQGVQMTISNTSGDTAVAIDDRNHGGTRTATIDTLSTNPQYLQLNGDVIPGTIYVQRTTTTKNIDVYTGTGQVTVNVLATIGRGLNLIGNSANTTVNIGNNGSLDGIGGLQMTVSNTIGDTAVVIDDRNHGGTRTATIDTLSTNPQYLQLNGDVIPGTIYVQRTTTAKNVDLYTGTGQVTVNVLATIGRGLNLIGNSPDTTVNIGKNGSLDSIQGLQMTVSNTSGDTGVVIDDRNRGGTRTATIDTLSTNPQYLQLNGNLIPGTIYVQRTTTAKNIDVYTGTGQVTVNVLATIGGGLNLIGNSATTTVNIGKNGSLDGIQGPVTVNGKGGTTLNVNDQSTTTSKIYEIHANVVKRVLNPDLVTYDAVINYANVGTLTVNGGKGGNIFFVVGSAAGTSTSLNGGAGGDQFAVIASSNALLGPVALHGRPGTNSFMTYDDQANAAAQTYTLTTNALSRSGLAPLTDDNLNQVVLFPALVGGNTINVLSLAAGVFDNLVALSGDAFTIGSNQTVAAILGTLRVETSDNASVSVAIDDSGNPTQPAGPIAFSNSPGVGYQISGLVPQGIYLLAGQNSTLTTSLRTGAGDKTFTMQDAPQGVALTLDAGSGTNTLDYTGYTGNVLVDLPLGTATGFSGISHIQNVEGASGGAPGNYNILVGNGGNVLTGGSGRRNLLIAGSSASQLFGGTDEDILIGGTTAYDMEGGMASLQAIMAYWTGADDYATRVNNLTTGNGVPLLDATMVLSNGAGNTLLGSDGLDLFFGSLGLDNHDKQDGEVFIEV